MKLWAFRTVAVPEDRHETRVFADGRTVRELVGDVCTTLPDGTAENHGMVHPSYMASGIPQAPQGMDWPYFSLPDEMLLHALGAVELGDPDGALLEERILQTLEASSLAHEGRIVPEEAARWCHGQQDPAIMRERTIASLAFAYLVHRSAGPGPAASDPAEFAARTRGVHVYPHGGLAVHNHSHGRTTVSWRNHVMVLPAPPEGMRLIGPAKGSLSAAVTVEGVAPTSKPRGPKIREDLNQICVLVIEDIAEETLRRRLFCASTEDGEAVVWERVWALQSARITAVSHGRLCIINDGLFGDHPDLRGRRHVWWPGGGRVFEGFVTKDASQDVVVELGAARDSGGTDRCIASPDAQPGQVMCEMLAVWVPEHPHLDAAAAIPVVDAWDADGLTARVGRWKAECLVPDAADARSARIAIEGA